MKETKPFLPSGLGNTDKNTLTASETSLESLGTKTPLKLEKPSDGTKKREWKSVFVNDEPIRPEKTSITTSTSSEMVASPSMSLIDDCTTLLFATMKGQRDSVNDICNCAKQIQSLLRLKLDAMKLEKEFKNKGK